MNFTKLLILVTASGVLTGSAQTADDLLKTARFVATLQQQVDLTGNIRKDGRKFSVGLYLRGENIQLAYIQPQGNKEVRFHLRLKPSHYDLFDVGPGGEAVPFPDAKLAQAIEGTDLSYEDLAMRFLYWPKGIVEGTEKLKGQECWQLRMINPSGKGRYAQVRVWVHKKSNALMQVVGYNAQGRSLKRFQVTDIMKVGDVWTLQRMRVDSVDPVANKVTGNTYLEFDRPKAVVPDKLR